MNLVDTMSNKTSLAKDDLNRLIIINIIMSLVAIFFITNDGSIPYWDLKVHAQRSLELLSATKDFDIKKIFHLMASDRAPGIALLLAPIFLFFPANLDSLQFFTLLIYSNIFIVGSALLAKHLWPKYSSTWFFILPALCPLLWYLGLKPYFDVGPLTLTPWVILLALRTNYFQNIKASALFGAVFALEIVFRSYGAYLCIAFSLAYMIHYLEGAIIKPQEDVRYFRTLQGILVAAMAFLPVAFVPAGAIAYAFMVDMGSFSYLWGTTDRWFYLNSLHHHGLGAILFGLGFIGLLSLTVAGAKARLIVYFFVIAFGIFQYMIDNKADLYSGVFAAIFIFAAAYLLTLLSEKVKEKSRKLMVPKVLAIGFVLTLGHQVYVHLFPVSSLIHKQFARVLQYPNVPVYANTGNQQRVLEQILTTAKSAGISEPGIYFGKDRQELNYDYINWLKYAEGKASRYSSWHVHHSDVPRYHGIPVNFFDMDFVVTGNTQSLFNKKLLTDYAEGRLFLKNYAVSEVLNLEVNGKSEPITLYWRQRQLDVKEQIAFQESILNLDAENFHNIEQLLWLYKLKAVNKMADAPEALLLDAAKMIPRHFSSSNIKYAHLEPYARLLGDLPEGEKAPYKAFFDQRGNKLNGSNFDLNEGIFDNPYNPDWLFMVYDRNVWVPLVAQKWVGEVWSDRKLGSLISTSHIDVKNRLVVKDKPLGVFWVAPASGTYTMQCAITSADPTALIKGVEITINDKLLKVGAGGGNSITSNVSLTMKKNDIIAIKLNGSTSYVVKAAIKEEPKKGGRNVSHLRRHPGL